MEKLLTKLKQLNLPVDEYAIFGSGPMVVRNMLRLRYATGEEALFYFTLPHIFDILRRRVNQKI